MFCIPYSRLFWAYLKKNADNPSIRIYENKIENRIIFKIKTGSYPELLIPKKMKLIGRTESKITKDKNGENVSHLEINEVVLVHCNDYWHNLRVLYTFISNKLFSQLLDISQKKLIFSKTFNSDFSYVEVWFTDQNSKPLGIEEKLIISLVIT